MVHPRIFIENNAKTLAFSALGEEVRSEVVVTIISRSSEKHTNIVTSKQRELYIRSVRSCLREDHSVVINLPIKPNLDLRERVHRQNISTLLGLPYTVLANNQLEKLSKLPINPDPSFDDRSWNPLTCGRGVASMLGLPNSMQRHH